MTDTPRFNYGDLVSFRGRARKKGRRQFGKIVRVYGTSDYYHINIAPGIDVTIDVGHGNKHDVRLIELPD
jgi:hypothetical protein